MKGGNGVECRLESGGCEFLGMMTLWDGRRLMLPESLEKERGVGVRGGMSEDLGE